MELSFANGVQEYTVHGVKGDVIIRFNPTDGAFIQRLYNAFDTLDKKQDKYADKVKKCGDRVEIFNIADRRDKEMREIIDGLFEEPVCDSIFGGMNLYAMADGLHIAFTKTGPTSPSMCSRHPSTSCPTSRSIPTAGRNTAMSPAVGSPSSRCWNGCVRIQSWIWYICVSTTMTRATMPVTL